MYTFINLFPVLTFFPFFYYYDLTLFILLINSYHFLYWYNQYSNTVTFLLLSFYSLTIFPFSSPILPSFLSLFFPIFPPYFPLIFPSLFSPLFPPLSSFRIPPQFLALPLILNSFPLFDFLLSLSTLFIPPSLHSSRCLIKS